MQELAKRISGYDQLDPSRICYWKTSGPWLMHLPGAGLGDLRNHQVTEHEDGTITVTPSILVTTRDGMREIRKHGYLTRGEWKDC